MCEKDNETKRKIVSVALALFRRVGYDSATVSDICRTSGISKHTFYYYFKSKDDLLFAFKSLPKEIRAEKLHSLMTAENNFEAYWRLVSTHIDFFEGLGAEIAKRIFILNLKNEHGSLGKPPDGAFAEIEADLIRKAQEAGEIRNLSVPRELVSVGYALIVEAIMAWVICGGERNLKDTARRAVEIAFDVPPENRR